MARKPYSKIFSMGKTRNINIIRELNMKLNNSGKQPAGVSRRLDKMTDTADYYHTRQN